MKSLPFCSKSALLVIQLAWSFGALTVAQGTGKDPLSPGPVRPGLDYRTELAQGYLTVYSATDQFNDGGVLYYVHSSYSIYASSGKLFRKVENHVSLNDERPEVVMLPTGSYTVEARSETQGYLRVRVAITSGRPTILDLEREQTDTQRRLLRAKNSQRLANQ